MTSARKIECFILFVEISELVE